jgi:transposase
MPARNAADSLSSLQGLLNEPFRRNSIGADVQRPTPSAACAHDLKARLKVKSSDQPPNSQGGPRSDSHLMENFYCKLKQYRAVAARYDKTARNFLAAIHLAAAAISLN